MVAGEVLFLSLFFFLFLLFTKREMDSVKLGKMATVRASIRMDERGGGERAEVKRRERGSSYDTYILLLYHHLRKYIEIVLQSKTFE